MATHPALVAQRTGALYGLLGVALGAFAAHAIRAHLTQLNTVDIWRTAVLYQFVHAGALLAVGQGSLVSIRTVILWTIGIFFFSGSLYFLAWDPSWWGFGPFTPIGGLLLMAGWASLMWDLRGRRVRP
jgi:uncharacterized membrane protein YgdD (TMEM256/DUF423 family)